MKKIVTPASAVLPYPEISKISQVNWEAEAIESLQSLERYTVLKALEEGKRLVKRVMEIASKEVGENQTVKKINVQTAISSVLEEIELTKQKPDVSLPARL
jgi:flagellar biosynthesis/type III secretory pathway protein FliH